MEPIGYQQTAFSGQYQELHHDWRRSTASSIPVVTIVYRIYISNSEFYHSNQCVNSRNSVTVMNSTFYNITTAAESGGGVYSENSVTVLNCNFTKCISLRGYGAAVHSTRDVIIINTTVRECSARFGGAVATEASNGHINITISRSKFINNTASAGGVLYTRDNGFFSHHIELTNSIFISNEATGNLSSGGVAFVRNTSLVITSCVFDSNRALTSLYGTSASHGGVLDMVYSIANIQGSTFSNNSAGSNGGVFYGREYSTNITMTSTTIANNAAEKGGVFYVRKANSNIQVTDSIINGNTASNQGGVMDVRGVTVSIDKNTFIANNTATVSGNVISACVCQITAYGLIVEPDPTYPMYCSVYDEGSSSYPMPTQGVTTGADSFSSETDSEDDTITTAQSTLQEDSTTNEPSTAQSESDSTSSPQSEEIATTTSILDKPQPNQSSEPVLAVTELAGKEKFNDMQSTSQQNILLVTIAFLLGILCVAASVMVVVLIVIACRKGKVTSVYLKVPLTDKIEEFQEEKQKNKEHSFTEN